jgi:alkylation response protein AidB-like acyl-CoA dehydrogenase
MDFELTEEQRIIKASAQKLMDQEVTPYLDSFPYGYILNKEEVVRLLKMLRPMNFLGATLPEEIGGGGIDFMDYALMMEELDYRIFGLIMITAGSAGMVMAAGTEDQKKRLFQPLLEGEMIGCHGISEPNVGSNTGAIETRAVLDGDHYVLNGTKMWITNGSYADVATVLANEDPSKGSKGLSRFFVEKATSPFEARPISIMGDGPIQHVGELIFEDCRIPKENKFGFGSAGGGSERASMEGLKQTLIAFQGARCFVGMNSLIIAQKAYEHALQYAKERTQFGKPIGQFQLIQAMIADMKALIDASRLLIYRGVSLVQKGVRCAEETSMAKFFATEAAVKVASMAVQIHGAYGLSTEYPVEHLFRHARVLTIPDGTTQIQKLVVAREVLGGLSAFS